MRKKWIPAVFGIVALAALITWIPWSRSGVDLPPPLTLAQAQALPDEQVVPHLTKDLAGRLLRAKGTPEAWRRLPLEARNVWITATCEPHLLHDDLLTFLVIQSPDFPDLASIRDAYSDIGAERVAAAVDEVLTVAEGSGHPAIEACREFQARTHAPPSVHPPGTVDPFAASAKVLAAAIAASRTGELRAAYARRNLEEIVTAK